MDPLYGQRTTYPKQNNNDWILVDAKDQTLGRLASKLAERLMGKHKADFQPSVLVGDSIVVINASQIRVSGKKYDDKVYFRHSGYMGGLKKRTMAEQMEIDPGKVIVKAVKGMLPKNRLASKMLARLRVFPSENHNLEAQNPKKVDL